MSEEFGVVQLEQDAGQDNDIASTTANLLLEHHNVLLFGPPGTGKTELVREVANRLRESAVTIDTTMEHDFLEEQSLGDLKIGFVTFHQSYSYEDFIIGIRPDLDTDKLLSLKPNAGILLELAEHARHAGCSSLLIIDELNRGNVSRIFGEFITLMEPDKRLKADGTRHEGTIAIELPHLGGDGVVHVRSDQHGDQEVRNPYTLPRNLYVLATMNSVDKSVAPLDAALRRRFRIVHLGPEVSEAALNQKFSLVSAQEASENRDELMQIRTVAMKAVKRLNRAICFFRDPDYMLGYWYLSELAKPFTSTDQAIETLSNIWKHKIQPQLEDLFQARAEQLGTALRLSELPKGRNVPLSIAEPEYADLEKGASPFIQRHTLDPQSYYDFLKEFVGMSSAPSTEPADQSTSTSDILTGPASDNSPNNS